MLYHFGCGHNFTVRKISFTRAEEKERGKRLRERKIQEILQTIYTAQQHNMFDGMHQFISFSSPSSSRPPLPSSLHHQQISSPFPASFPVASPAPIISPPPPPPNQSIQFSDLFHRPNLPSFHHLNPAPSSHNLISSKQYTSDQHTNRNSISDVLEAEVHPEDDVGFIRSLFPPAAASSSTLLAERERRSSSPPTLHQHEFWSNEEVVALLRIRSSSETSWFPPDFTWEHVSRKLAAIGFKRSAKTCKEKFEEESKTCFNIFNNRVISDRNSYRFFSELEDICGRDDDNAEKSAIQLQANDREEDPIININDHQDMQVEEEEGIECENKANTRCNVFEEDANGVSPTMIIQQYSQREQLECREKVMKAKAKKKKKKKIRRNKQEHKFQIMKGLCEGLVNKMMTQQEELHNKILEDLLKRDEENKAREEAWKRMEVERLNTELEMRAQEQAIAGDRQAAIIELLSTTTTSATSHESRRGIIDANIVAHLLKPIPHMSTKVITQSHDQNPPPPDQSPCPNLQTLIVHEALEPPQTPTSTIEPHISNPPACLPASYSTTPVDSSGGHSASAQLICYPKPSTKKAIIQQPNNNSRAGILSEEDQHGVRWPRDQVLALINLRCSLLTNKNGDNEERDDGNKQQAPLWERISRKMSQLGYQRSAKRCKEKWENINKYFRKTKDNNVNKKRSNDSRTCPYFHQLSQLYEQGTLTAPSHHHTSLLENGQNKM